MAVLQWRVAEQLELTGYSIFCSAANQGPRPLPGSLARFDVTSARLTPSAAHFHRPKETGVVQRASASSVLRVLQPSAGSLSGER